jgi:hypothetical protein
LGPRRGLLLMPASLPLLLLPCERGMRRRRRTNQLPQPSNPSPSSTPPNLETTAARLDPDPLSPAAAQLPPAEGYEVYIVTDASGTFSAPVRDAALARATGAGAVLINWFAVACELQRDWRLGPNSGLGLAKLLSVYLPEYGNLISSHSAAVAVGKTSG